MCPEQAGRREKVFQAGQGLALGPAALLSKGTNRYQTEKALIGFFAYSCVQAPNEKGSCLATTVQMEQQCGASSEDQVGVSPVLILVPCGTF